MKKERKKERKNEREKERKKDADSVGIQGSLGMFWL